MNVMAIFEGAVGMITALGGFEFIKWLWIGRKADKQDLKAKEDEDRERDHAFYNHEIDFLRERCKEIQRDKDQLVHDKDQLYHEKELLLSEIAQQSIKYDRLLKAYLAVQNWACCVNPCGKRKKYTVPEELRDLIPEVPEIPLDNE